MNNLELFIKYVDNQFSEKEKELFDRERNNNPHFRKELNKFLNSYNDSKSIIQVDQRYFNSLIPKARKRISKPKTNHFIKLAYLLPVVLIGLYFLIQKPRNIELNYEYLFDTTFSTEEITEVLYNNSVFFESLTTAENDQSSEYLNYEMNLDESIFGYLEDRINLSDINDNLISELSENEFSNLYEELNNKKY